jgi:hypothetical protein
LDQPWRSQTTRIVTTMPLMRAICARSKHFSRNPVVTHGPDGARILLPAARPDASDLPIGALHVRWHAPVEGHATIERVEWSADLSDSDAPVWDAMRALLKREVG